MSYKYNNKVENKNHTYIISWWYLILKSYYKEQFQWLLGKNQNEANIVHLDVKVLCENVYLTP